MALNDFTQFRQELAKVSASVNRSVAQFDGRAKLALAAFAFRVEASAKALCPVDTGYLRSSIGHDFVLHGNDLGVEIGPTANYGWFVEGGTTRQAPQPYMAPAFDKHQSALEQAIAQITNPFRDA